RCRFIHYSNIVREKLKCLKHIDLSTTANEEMRLEIEKKAIFYIYSETHGRKGANKVTSFLINQYITNIFNPKIQASPNNLNDVMNLAIEGPTTRRSSPGIISLPAHTLRRRIVRTHYLLRCLQDGAAHLPRWEEKRQRIFWAAEVEKFNSAANELEYMAINARINLNSLPVSRADKTPLQSKFCSEQKLGLQHK
ncbi:hypothetical protein L9F63_008341, partial [Diploptera punctata]